MKRILIALLLLAGSASAADLTITWTDNSSNELGFRIERRLASGPAGLYDGVATVGIDVESYTDTGLAPSTQYCYRVIVINEFAEGTPTAEECETTAVTGEVAWITGPQLPNATLGIAYAAPDLECQGGDGTYVFTVTVGTLPSAIALSAAGEWSGTPGVGTAGVHSITIECDDEVGTPATRNFTLPVNQNSPAILTTILPNGVEDAVYTSGPIEASCPLPPCVLSVFSGALCAGTTLSDTSPPGAITGTPTTPEVCNLVLRVTDNLTQTDDQALTMSVEAATFTVSVDVAPSTNGAVVTYGSDDLDSETNCTATLLHDSSIVSVQESLSGPTFRQASFSGLTPSTEYDVEVDCVNAAAVASETFTTLADPGTSGVAVKLKVKPNSILSGVVSVFVEWGEESLGVFESSRTVACASGCSVSISGLDPTKVYLLRFSWLDIDGNVVARSQRDRRLIP